MNTRTFHADTSSHRINTIVIGFNGYLSPFSRNTYHVFNRDQTVEYFRDFILEESFEEYGWCTGKNDVRGSVLHFHANYDSPDGISFLEKIAGNLFLFRENQLISLVIQYQNFFFPHLINFAGHDLAHFLFIFGENVIFFQFKNPGRKVLSQCQNGTTSEIFEFHFVCHLFSHFIVCIDFLGFCQRDLGIRIFESIVFYHDTVSPDFQVSFVDIYDDVKILVRSVTLDKHVSEYIFQHSHQGCPINIFKFFKFCKWIYQINGFHFYFMYLENNNIFNLLYVCKMNLFLHFDNAFFLFPFHGDFFFTFDHDPRVGMGF